jgi:prepilin signal peptidase PulO-like enzyme (type II secretory pathway)
MGALVALAAFALIFILLAALAAYDCKHYILPDMLNLALAIVCGIFHIANGWTFLSPLESLAGAAGGGGFLLLIRAAASRFYNDDALGLGDVKLMAAAGIGLGFPGTMLALCLGAMIGLIHGLFMGWAEKRRGGKVDFARINVPAGLGLCCGIAIVMTSQFGSALPWTILHTPAP